MSALELAICGLSAWRLARLIALDDGPFDVFARLRGVLLMRGGELAKGLLACPFWCLTVWTAAIVALTWNAVVWIRWLWIWLAIAQIAAQVGLWTERLVSE